MATYFVQRTAGIRMDGIYQYTKKEWGEAQADKYIKGLFEHFQGIADLTVLSKPIPAEFEVTGFVSRYQKYFVYWKPLNKNDVGIVTIFHERMHQMERFNDDF